MTLTIEGRKTRQLVLGRDVLLARFERHYSDGRYLINSVSEVKVKGTTISKNRASLPRSVVLPDEVHDELRRGFRPLDSLVDSLTPYPIANLRGMTEAQLEDFVPRWNEAYGRLILARAAVRDMWADAVDDWNRRYWEPILGADYEKSIGSKLVRIREDLDRLYSMDYDLWQPPQPVDVAMGSPVVRKWLEDGRVNAEKAVEEALLAFVAGPRDALIAAAQKMAETIRDKDTKLIKPGTFNAMRNAMQKLRALRDISDVALIDQINKMENTLDEVIGTAEASGLGFTATVKAQASELVAGIGEVIEAARDRGARDDILTAFGRSGRAIEFD
jgi:hypothetical protein